MQNTHFLRSIPFWQLSIASLLFSASFNMLIPELPSYLASLGGAKYVGLIISLFTLTAGISRPFSGILTDKIGRKPVMIFGAVVCIICGALYPVLGSVAGFLLLRLLHGFSTGFSPTALSTYVSDIVPHEKWGEALGIQSLFFTLGLALGPAIGSNIKLLFSYNVLFYSSSLMAFLSILIIFSLKETVPKKHTFRWSLLKISRHDIIAMEVFPPALITFLGYFAFGMVLTLIPDWSDHLGLKNKGSFFITFTIASLAVRFIAGKVSDRFGRTIVVKTGLVLLAAALVLMARFQTPFGLLFSAVAYGVAMGVLSPALSAWTFDLSFESQRGKGIATMFIALEAGIGLGALLSGWYYQTKIENIPTTMLDCALMPVIGLGYLIVRKK